MRTFAWLSSLTVLALAACGGNVVVDPPRLTGTGGAMSSTVGSTSGPGGTTSFNATSSSSTGAGGAPTDCANLGFAIVGEPCNQEGQSCQMTFSCCAGIVRCTGGIWTSMAPDCAQACEPCGAGLSCAIGALCVHDLANAKNGFQCVHNPCVGPSSCACASSACEMNFEQCLQTNLNTVTCD